MSYHIHFHSVYSLYLFSLPRYTFYPKIFTIILFHEHQLLYCNTWPQLTNSTQAWLSLLLLFLLQWAFSFSEAELGSDYNWKVDLNLYVKYYSTIQRIHRNKNWYLTLKSKKNFQSHRYPKISRKAKKAQNDFLKAWHQRVRKQKNRKIAPKLR